MLIRKSSDAIPDQKLNKVKKNQINSNADTLTLQTRIAQSLFDGKWVEGQMGLLQFAAHISEIYYAYQEDDPYAEWTLMKTYEALEHSLKQAESYQEQLKQDLKKLNGINLNKLTIDDRWIRPLQFNTFYPFLTALLLRDIDQIVMQLITLKRYGLIQLENEVTNRMAANLAQSVFSTPLKWKKTSVKRSDILDKTPKSLDAKTVLEKLIKEWGELPDEVLHERIQLTFLPKKPGRSHESTK